MTKAVKNITSIYTFDEERMIINNTVEQYKGQLNKFNTVDKLMASLVWKSGVKYFISKMTFDIYWETGISLTETALESLFNAVIEELREIEAR